MNENFILFFVFVVFIVCGNGIIVEAIEMMFSFAARLGLEAVG